MTSERFGEIKKQIESRPHKADNDEKLYRIPYGFQGYKPPPRKPVIKEGTPEYYRLLSVCTTEMEKEIAILLFCDGLKAEYVADEVGYCERQIYRIKKKLKARLMTNEM